MTDTRNFWFVDLKGLQKQIRSEISGWDPDWETSDAPAERIMEIVKAALFLAYGKGKGDVER
jgi:hypothetical protein